MLITLKTLQQMTFKIDIDPEETVRVKSSIKGGGVGSDYVLGPNSLFGVFMFMLILLKCNGFFPLHHQDASSS